MFSLQHILWLCICTALIVGGFLCLMKFKPPLETVLTIACVLCVLSELVKTFCAVELVPSTGGKKLYPYMELQHLPLHLCSLQILLIFYTRFTGNRKMREIVLAFLYPTCVAGAFFALIIPTIFNKSVALADAFTDPWAYQYFLYHAMLILLGGYIALSGQVDIRPRHYFTTMGTLGILAVASLYLNSMFAVPTYKNGKLISVNYTTNFFFTYKTPVGIALTEKWHWFTYLAVVALLAMVLVGLLYLPFFWRKKEISVKRK